jgi:EAL domain-containing protein (putative c-di-GMP-specific phosphodiesterase class I)
MAYSQRTNDASIAAPREATRRGEEALAESLRHAIDDGALDVALQPRVVLATGQLAGFEALARWTLPDGTPVQPRGFIALATRHGLLRRLDERMLERTLDVVADWRDHGLPLLPVAVEFLVHALAGGDAAERVERALAQRGLPGAVLELELTEPMLQPAPGATLDALDRLSRLGVAFSVESFGTGASWWVYLGRFALHRAKLERSLVGALPHDATARGIVRSVLHLARGMGRRCVAEGVESHEQRTLLAELGCDEAQGYAVARPMPPSDAAARLAREAPWQPLALE